VFINYRRRQYIKRHKNQTLQLVYVGTVSLLLRYFIFPRFVTKQSSKWWRNSTPTVEAVELEKLRRLTQEKKRNLNGKWDPVECWYKKGPGNRTLRWQVCAFESPTVHSVTISMSVPWPHSVSDYYCWIILSIMWLM
jgi:GH15 family glucan-1,4-alpha-glucosidase